MKGRCVATCRRVDLATCPVLVACQRRLPGHRLLTLGRIEGERVDLAPHVGERCVRQVAERHGGTGPAADFLGRQELAEVADRPAQSGEAVSFESGCVISLPGGGGKACIQPITRGSVSCADSGDDWAVTDVVVPKARTNPAQSLAMRKIEDPDPRLGLAS